MTVIDADFDLGDDRPFTVTFTEPELHDVLEIGRGRDKVARTRGRKPKAGHSDDKRRALADNEVGILGEAAVAQVFDWNDDDWNPLASARRFEGDVAGLEVRASDQYPHLLVRPDDPPGRIYVKTRVRRRPESVRVEIIGWIYGDEAQQPEFARAPDNGRPPIYLVPPDRLRPMREVWLLLEGRAS